MSIKNLTTDITLNRELFEVFLLKLRITEKFYSVSTSRQPGMEEFSQCNKTRKKKKNRFFFFNLESWNQLSTLADDNIFFLGKPK